MTLSLAFLFQCTRYEKLPYWHFLSHIGANMGVQYGMAPYLDTPIWDSPIWVIEFQYGSTIPILDILFYFFSIILIWWDRYTQYGIFISNMGF